MQKTFYHPGQGVDDQGGHAAQGAAAHCWFASYEGDLPTV